MINTNKWVIGTVNEFSVNRGNALIDEGFQIAWEMAGLLPLHKVSIFSKEITKYKHIISVGCTSLCANSGNAGFLHDMDCEIIMCGGSLWNNYSTDIAEKCIEPIGVRDPVAYSFLKNKGYEVELIGCPAVFIQPGKLTEDYILVSLPRPRSFDPEAFLKNILDENKGKLIKGVCHEQYEIKIFEKSNVDIIEDMKQAYSSAKEIITGRLHGAILGTSWNKDVTYTYDKSDSRNSLWEIDFLDLKNTYISFLSKRRIT